MYFVPRQELRRVESRETGIWQRVRLLTGMFISQPQRQRERGGRLPALLNKVGLAELIGVENRRAEEPGGFGRRPAIVVQKVRKSGITHRRCEGDIPKRCSGERLSDALPQELHTVTER